MVRVEPCVPQPQKEAQYWTMGSVMISIAVRSDPPSGSSIVVMEVLDYADEMRVEVDCLAHVAGSTSFLALIPTCFDPGSTL